MVLQAEQQEQHIGAEVAIQVPVGICGTGLVPGLHPLSAVALEPGRYCKLNGICVDGTDVVPVATASIMALLARDLACISSSKFPAGS